MLTDIAAVRALLQQEDGDDTFADALITDLIEAASQLIARYTNREFEQPSDRPVARDFLGIGQVIDLAPYDLRQLDSTDDVTDGDPVEITGVRVRPRPARDGVYTWLELPDADACDQREVEVTGLWGWPAVPDDVRLWCGITVVTWLRSDVAAFSTTFQIDEGRTQRPEELPSAVRHALRGYKRPTPRMVIV